MKVELDANGDWVFQLPDGVDVPSWWVEGQEVVITELADEGRVWGLAITKKGPE